jgi:hypothetical protein
MSMTEPEDLEEDLFADLLAIHTAHCFPGSLISDDTVMMATMLQLQPPGFRSAQLPLIALRLSKRSQPFNTKNPILHMYLQPMRLLIPIKQMVMKVKMAQQDSPVGLCKMVTMSV